MKISLPPPMPDENLRQAKDRKKARWVVIGCLFLGSFALIAILLPKLADRIREPSTRTNRGTLGAIRSALSIYYGEMEGVYPSALESLTVGKKYLSDIPPARTPPYHPDSSVVRYGPAPDDTGGWWYNNISSDGNFGSIVVNCTHTDEKGSTWTVY